MADDLDLGDPKSVLEFWRSKVPLPYEKFLKLELRSKPLAVASVRVWNTLFLTEVQESLDSAMKEGLTSDQWAKSLERTLADFGGYQAVGNNEFKTGYVDMFFRTNTQTAYQAGRNSVMFSEARQKIAPYFMFSAISDDRTDEDCDQLDGEVFPKNSWDAQRFLPPLHYNCRCTLIEYDEQDLEDEGLTLSNPGDFDSEDILFDNRAAVNLLT